MDLMKLATTSSVRKSQIKILETLGVQLKFYKSCKSLNNKMLSYAKYNIEYTNCDWKVWYTNYLQFGWKNSMAL